MGTSHTLPPSLPRHEPSGIMQAGRSSHTLGPGRVRVARGAPRASARPRQHFARASIPGHVAGAGCPPRLGLPGQGVADAGPGCVRPALSCPCFYTQPVRPRPLVFGLRPATRLGPSRLPRATSSSARLITFSLARSGRVPRQHEAWTLSDMKQHGPGPGERRPPSVTAQPTPSPAHAPSTSSTSRLHALPPPHGPGLRRIRRLPAVPLPGIRSCIFPFPAFTENRARLVSCGHTGQLRFM